MSNGFPYLVSADLTDVGHRRKNNEDSVLRLPEQGVFCVADGMGGVQGGEVASKATVEALKEAYTAWPEAPFAVTMEAGAQVVGRALNRASQWIKARGAERGLAGTGSTVVVLVFDRVTPSQAMILHAGDSRVYRYREDKLEQLSADHSVAAAAGLPDDKNLPAMFRGVITRAVGLENGVVLEKTPVDVMARDLFLLCSDGLNKMVSDKALHKVLRKHRDDDIQVLARVLINEALKAGGEDNVSVVLVRVAVNLPAGPTMEVPPQTRVLEQMPTVPVEAAPDEDAVTEDPERVTGQTVDTVQTRDPAAQDEGEGLRPPENSCDTPQTPATPFSGVGVTPQTTPVPEATIKISAEEMKTLNAAAGAVKSAARFWVWLAVAFLAVAGGVVAWFLWLKK